MSYWIIELEDGSVQQIADEPGTRGNPEGLRSAPLPRLLRMDGVETWDWEAGAIVCDLGMLRTAAIDRINAAAEAVRARFLTPGAGQAMTYARKETEARAWTADAPDSDFPFLAAEAAACGVTMADVATLVIAQADAWVTIGAAIEGLRRGATVAIEAADAEDAIAAAEAIDWTAITVGLPTSSPTGASDG